MPRLFPGLIFALASALSASCILAADAPAESAPSPAAGSPAETARQQLATTAGAVVASRAAEEPKAPDFVEHLVDLVLSLFDVRSSGNTVTHYVISSVLFIVALLARRIVTLLIFPMLRRLASKTATTLDDNLFPALESPAAAFVMVVGIFASLQVLKLPPELDAHLPAGSKVAFSLVIFWALWRALAAVLEHLAELARARSSTAAAFMPWIKKSVLTVFMVLGALLLVESLGYNVKAILAGLGIGGLAFALAAQDTLANIFGAIVVAVDQPFLIGETVRIGTNVGMVEDIGLRSTRIRLVDKSLMVIPNKTVAAETITNLSRFTRRPARSRRGERRGVLPRLQRVVARHLARLRTRRPRFPRGHGLPAAREPGDHASGGAARSGLRLSDANIAFRRRSRRGGKASGSRVTRRRQVEASRCRSDGCRRGSDPPQSSVCR